MVASGAPGATRQVTFTELVTRLGDGDHRGLTTNNSTQPTAFAPVPGRTLHRLPGERDLRRLLRVHRALVARAGVPPAPSRLADVGPERLLAESTAREMAAQVAAGYLVAAGDHYRPTWRGAFTMTWRLLWPIKSLRESQVRRRAAALLRELGV
jgi:hypothetical protein